MAIANREAVDAPADVYDAAYQGAPGAYSEAAAQALLPPEPRTWPRPTLEDVFAAVAEGRARHGVIPVENTLAGTVPHAYELLLAHELQVIGETQVHIDHVLVGRPGSRHQALRRVLSHPVALAQCTRFFRSHPSIEPVAVFDTAGAVEMVMRDGDGTTAAIASRRAAALYGAEIFSEHLQDHDENWTRFLLLSRGSDPRTGTEAAGASAPDRAAKILVAFDLPHVPGSLAGALRALAGRGVNLTKIESRPIVGQPFEYRFIAELSLDESDAGLTDVVAGLRDSTRWLRVLGTCARRPS